MTSHSNQLLLVCECDDIGRMAATALGTRSSWQTSSELFGRHTSAPPAADTMSTTTTTVTGLLNLTILLSNITTVVDYDEAALYENFTLEEFLQFRRGLKTLPYSVVVPITVLYALIFLTGMVGNVAVCTVIARNSSMHTATNYYLFSLALSDLTILLLGLPNDLYVYWHQYPWGLGLFVCKLRALVSETTSYSSVLTIVAFSTERYLAICHPLHAYTMSGLKRASRIIGALWVISLLCAAPFAYYTTIDYLEFPPKSGQIVEESAFCAMLETPENFPIYEASSFIFFVVPMLVLVVLYTRMAIQIRRRTMLGFGRRRVEGSMHSQGKSSQSPKSIIRMLTAVVIAFFLCWAPFHAQRLLYVYLRESPSYKEHNEWIYHLTGCFYYFSSTVNPILYNVMSAKYRLAFRATLCRLSSPSRRSLPSAASFRAVSSQDVSMHAIHRSINGRINRGNGVDSPHLRDDHSYCDEGECSSMVYHYHPHHLRQQQQQHLQRAATWVPGAAAGTASSSRRTIFSPNSRKNKQVVEVTLVLDEKNSNNLLSLPAKVLLVLKNKQTTDMKPTVSGSSSKTSGKKKSKVHMASMSESNSDSEMTQTILSINTPDLLLQNGQCFVASKSEPNIAGIYEVVPSRDAETRV